MTAINEVRRAISISVSLLTASIICCGSGILPASSQPVATLTNGMPPTTIQEVKRSPLGSSEDSGTLVAMLPGGTKQLGNCPLKHTDVKAQISGYVARVSVKQTFNNTFKNKIEAIYTFPLPENAAVDEMTMTIGDRVIKGNIKKREEARQIYEAARASGHVASLLDQERPNIFTQSVANIEPGAQVQIEIKYVDMLPYEDGNFSFTFPTVVGPRFNPGKPVSHSGTGREADTDLVPDASKITPPVARAGQRAGHDISIDVDIAAGVPIEGLSSKLHEVKIAQGDPQAAHVTLAAKSTIPNKDFVLSWKVAKDSLQSGYLTHRDEKSGYFTLMLLPPKRVAVENVAPREMVFLIDCSGSQTGMPLRKAQETLDYIVDHMNPNDTFQVLAFNNHVKEFAPKPQKASPEMRKKAKEWIDSLRANGGTWMGPAVEKVVSIPADEHRLRLVVFMTDGYVGNDFEIRGMIKKYRGTSRWFPFGTGNSVNRFLIDGIAREGGGEAEYVLLNSSGQEAAEKFYKRISSPVLTDVKLDFNGLPVKEVYPVDVSDVWAERPLYFKGRYLKPCAGTISLTGFSGGKPYSRDLKVVFPEKQEGNAVIKSIWARAKVDRLMSEDWVGAQRGGVNQELKDEIIKTALDYHLMTQYTSFVAVEEKTVTKDGKPVTVPVEVEMADGVSREQTIGEQGRAFSRHHAGSSSIPYVGAFGAPQAQPQGYTHHQHSFPGAYRYPAAAYPAPGFAARSSGGGAGAGAGMAGGPVAYGGLPSVNLGKSVSHPGDNMYTPSIADRRYVPSTAVSGALRPRAATKASDGPLKLESSKDQATSWSTSSAPAKENEEQRKSDAGSSKLDALLRQLMNAGTNKASEIAGLDIVDGKIAVHITLTSTSERVLSLLKSLGFELSKQTGSTVTGRISPESLKKLCDMQEVVKVHSTKLQP